MHNKEMNIKTVNNRSSINEDINMDERLQKIVFMDNGGRRSGVDRRQFSYTSYIPERRSGTDRRTGGDRRRIARISSRID